MCGDSREAVQHYYMLEQEGESANIKDEINEKVSEQIKEKQTEIEVGFEGWKKQENSGFNCIIDHEKEINNGKSKFINVGIFDQNGNATRVFHQGENAYFLYEIEVLKDITTPIAGIVFYDQRNTIIFGKDNLQTYTVVPDSVKAGTLIKVLFKIKMDIAVGEYTFDVGFNEINENDYNERSNRNQSQINEVLGRLSIISKISNFSVHEKKVGDPMKIMFHGCCDLPHNVQISMVESEEH
jgi:hypothetical protein